MPKYVDIKIAINIDGKMEYHTAKMEEGMHFQNNGDTYSIKDGSIWNSNNQKVDNIKMTKYQFNIFQALANNVTEEDEKGIVLSSADINDKENGALKKWSLGQFGADMSEYINKTFYSIKGTHHHKNRQGQTDGVEMDILQSDKIVATLKFWFDNASQSVQQKNEKSQKDTISQNEQKKENDAVSTEPQKNILTKAYNYLKKMFQNNNDDNGVKIDYPEGVDEISSYEYKIKNGDRIITIANEKGVSLERLMQENSQLDTNKIYPGQIINIPKRYSVENTTVSTKDDVAKYSNLSTDYVNFLVNFERMHLKPYNDGVGNGTLTVGIGHTGRLLGKYYNGCKEQDLDKRIELNSKTSKNVNLCNKEAYQILTQDLIDRREDAISYFGENFLKAPLSIQDAIVDIIFNKGIKKGLEGIGDDGKKFETPTSEIKKYLDEENYEEVAKHVIYATQNKGLQKRNIARVLLACRDLDDKTRKKVLSSCQKDYEEVMSKYTGLDLDIVKIKQQWKEYMEA